jgi:hypothetical protein
MLELGGVFVQHSTMFISIPEMLTRSQRGGSKSAVFDR